ncbi:latent-transforming growth factor beta-binding protein 4-like [Actinia tenebrosa]|uniref:Latent-transforming growth factor beta-binding protein 4-like n=1 Tax=Actinia tenebrosa TaxID=6105 RepID=A0A6P8IG07_ACTTE|nr:latent-transforming growth factor beta-binding protein 4-like [Actinia tenebrosa]
MDEVPMEEALMDEVLMDELPMDEVPMDEVLMDEVLEDDSMDEAPMNETILVFHATTIDCKSVLQNGCVFKHDVNKDEILDCGYKVLSEAPKIHQGCPNPKTINIHDSNLKTLPLDVFDHLEKLQTLSLRGNQLTTLSEKTFKKLRHLKKLDLSNNDLHCDCGLRWITESNIDVVGKCATPSFLANKELKKVSSAVLCDVDECRDAANPVCGRHSSCENTPGSFKCVCDRGFLSENEKTCSDIDECSTDQHNCSIQATCTNFPGGFRCSCNLGYLGNGHFCLETTEVSMVKRLMRKNRAFSFLVERKLVPHALIAVASLFVLIPVMVCLCVCCCQRRRLRRKYKGYERVSPNGTEEPRKPKQRTRFFRRRKECPTGLRKTSERRVTVDKVEGVPRYTSATAPTAPTPPPRPPSTSATPPPPAPAPPPPPPPPPPSTSAPPPPPPPPPVKRPPNV